jgi:GNAT superfamily N-acetyltransferase
MRGAAGGAWGGTIREAVSDEDFRGAARVIRELRPLKSVEEILAAIGRQRPAGYRLFIGVRGDAVVGSAGFRTGENIAWGRFLYVDDLVVDPAERSRGIGAALLAALRAEARRLGCAELHLDTNVSRAGAHRFYEREGLEWTSRHYRVRLGGEGGT